MCPAQASGLGSDPATTRARVELFRSYLTRHVLGPAGMTCSSAAECRSVALTGRDGQRRAGVSFAEGQLPHVGRHYDLVEDGSPLRILVIGMEMGEGEERITLPRRSEQIAVSAALRQTVRNPHMQGVMNALRLAVGREPGADRAGELLDLDEPVHLFDACALTNIRLCSAHGKGRKSKAQHVVTRNCLRHLAATIEILEPTLCVLQGNPDAASLAGIGERRVDLGPHLARWTIRGVETVVASFSHPSAWGALRWGGLNGVPYLYETVAPVIVAARAASGCR